VADVQILRAPASAVPSNYTLPDAAELRLKAVYADFTDSGAASDWLPTVTILSDSGDVIARAADQDVLVTAGDDASVSWFPRVRRRRSGVLGSGCRLLGSATADGVTLTLTLTKPVPGSGTLQVVFCTVNIGHNDDPGEPDNVFDSQGVAGWVWQTFNGPLIGLISEDLSGSGPAAITQAGSVARPCTAADLGAGDTITVHWATARPTELHLAGLIVYQQAYFVGVDQFGAVEFGNGDDHPGTGASLTRLSWVDDFGAGTVQNDRDAVMITAMGAYPPVAGFTPLEGTKIGEIASGSCSIAACCKKLCEGSTPDPGGTWPSAAIQLVGNYQFLQPRICSN
jgi:hypothetical protein